MEPGTVVQPAQTPPAEGMAPQEPASDSGQLSWLAIIGFLVLAGTVIGLFLWWVWMKSPFVLWLKIILSIIPFALFAALI